MKTVVGYLVEKDGMVIAATADEREAMYIARNWKGVSVKIKTTIIPTEDPKTEREVVFDGTI